MHDSESDTYVKKSPSQEFCDLLKEMGFEAQVEKLDTDEVENGNYYSKYFSHSPAMVTNHGCIKVKGSNIDVIQIIQKG